jgi:predicted metalloprotease with PDZ domain
MAPVASAPSVESKEIVLTVDATDAPRKILHVEETIPVIPGPLTLYFAKWVPGEHGPTGPVTDLSSLRIKAGGKPLSWRRDLVDMYAVHIDIPAGVEQIELTFDFLLSAQAEGFTSGASATSQLAVISLNQVILYPGGLVSDNVFVSLRMKFPVGWKFATALETIEHSGDVVRFATVSLTSLVDSPVLTGAHFRQIDITPSGGVRHTINIAADGEPALNMPSGQVEAYRRLVLEGNVLFGARHYNHYDFLVTLSSHVATFGLEHHQCSDNRMPERAIIDSSLQRVWAMLLPHEYAHSWNGKYRRPIGLSPSNFEKPLTGELLWVYEGLTEYFGELLAVRSGVSTPRDYKDYLALVAARLDNLPGRTWRSLQDVADAAQVLYEARGDGQSLRRGVDFYEESYLIWLEVEVMIRKMTDGKKSLNDFCQKFFGGKDSAPSLNPFTYDELMVALNEIAPFDWNSFWSERLQSLDAHAPLGGLEQSGWKVVYQEAPSGFHDAVENFNHTIDARFSLGIYLKDDGIVNDVIQGSPAAIGGIAPGMKLVAISGRKFSKEIFRDALKPDKNNPVPLEILASTGDYFKTFQVNYNGGERYPYLVRDSSRTDVLSEIILPIAVKSGREKR